MPSPVTAGGTHGLTFSRALTPEPAGGKEMHVTVGPGLSDSDMPSTVKPGQPKGRGGKTGAHTAAGRSSE